MYLSIVRFAFEAHISLRTAYGHCTIPARGRIQIYADDCSTGLLMRFCNMANGTAGKTIAVLTCTEFTDTAGNLWHHHSPRNVVDAEKCHLLLHDARSAALTAANVLHQVKGAV